MRLNESIIILILNWISAANLNTKKKVFDSVQFPLYYYYKAYPVLKDVTITDM